MRDKNLKYLIIVESPNKCKHFQEYLKKAGYKATVVASVGHIACIKDGGNYYNTGIDPQSDFKANLAVADDKYKVVEQLKLQVKAADHVVLATDSDNEGAQITWSLIKFLGLKAGGYSRLITHEITPKAVVRAFENPVKLDTDNAMASQARMCLDKMLGYRLSPLARTYIGAKSVGRCQSVGLKLIADREKEIQNFVPETYFDLYLNFEKNKTKFKAKFAGNNTIGNIEHLKTQKDVNMIKNSCIKNYTIEDIKKKEKEESPKPPFCTATFQQEAASKINLKVKDAMAVAQKLFETGFITYHRTIDQKMSDEFIPELKTFIEANYGKSAWTKPREGKQLGDEQNGHECLRVTDPSLTPDKYNMIDTSQLNQKVYKLIWQRTIAAALPNAKISETQYLIDNNDQKFILVSKELISPGFKAVYAYKDDDEKDDSGVVKETFKKGEILKNCALEDIKKETRPPARFSEATLIKKLEATGVGRPSTYATIVETVLSTSRGYAELQDKAIVPTDRGMQLAAFLDRSFSNIININYTKNMEENLDLIASGKKDKTTFLTEFYNTLEDTIKNSKELSSSETGETKICPECGAPMVVRRSKYGRLFYGCSKYPACRGIISIK